jgi:hypothetical protein
VCVGTRRTSVDLILTPLPTTVNSETARRLCVGVPYGFVCVVVIVIHKSAIKTRLYPVLSASEMYVHCGSKGQNTSSRSVL